MRTNSDVTGSAPAAARVSAHPEDERPAASHRRQTDRPERVIVCLLVVGGRTRGGDGDARGVGRSRLEGLIDGRGGGGAARAPRTHTRPPELLLCARRANAEAAQMCARRMARETALWPASALEVRLAAGDAAGLQDVSRAAAECFCVFATQTPIN